MSKKNYRRKTSKPYPIVPMAGGLCLIGFAFVVMTSPRSGSNQDSLSSVVPVSVNFAAPELSLENINGQKEKQ